MTDDPRVLVIRLQPQDVMTQDDTDKIGDILTNIALKIREKAGVENDGILTLVAIEMLRKALADFREFEAEQYGVTVTEDQEAFDELVEKTKPSKKGPIQ